MSRSYNQSHHGNKRSHLAKCKVEIRRRDRKILSRDLSEMDVPSRNKFCSQK